MSLDDAKRQELIAYRVEQAKEAMKDVEVLLANHRFQPAMNRIYYGMFYMLLALGLKYRFETSKHVQLIGWFNKTFMKEEIIPRKYGQMLRDAFKNRMNSDYEAFVTFTEAEISELFENMKDFITAIEQFIRSNP